MVEPSAPWTCSAESPTTDSVMAVVIVKITNNMRKMTIATNNQENGLVLGSATVRPNFSSVQVDYASSQRVLDGVPHYPQHRLGTGDERVAFPAPGTVGGFSQPLIFTHFRNQHISILAVGTETIMRDTARQFSAGAAFRPD